MSRLPALLALLVVPAAVAAQSSAILDDGTFTITRNGAPIGRESFKIVRTPAPGGQVFRASGTSVIGDTKTVPTLGTDSAGMPVSYEFLHSEKGAVTQRLQGRGRPGRFSILAQTKTGESAREYVLANGALLMDEGIFHHFFFVPLAAQHAQVTVIAPRTAQQSQYRLAERGAESVDIAGSAIPGRRFTLTATDGAIRDVWVDAQGRLLRVSIPEKGLVALRDDPPK